MGRGGAPQTGQAQEHFESQYEFPSGSKLKQGGDLVFVSTLNRGKRNNKVKPSSSGSLGLSSINRGSSASNASLGANSGNLNNEDLSNDEGLNSDGVADDN